MLTNLKILRMRKNKTQSEFAEKIGMSLPWYSMLENGRYIATENVRNKLEKAFNMSADYLLSEVKVIDERGGKQ